MKSSFDPAAVLDGFKSQVLDLLHTKFVFDSLPLDFDDPREEMRALRLYQVLYDDMHRRVWEFVEVEPRRIGRSELLPEELRSTFVDESRLLAAEAAAVRLRDAMPRAEEWIHTRVSQMAARRAHRPKPHPLLLPAIREAVAYVDALHGVRTCYHVGLTT